MIYTRAADADDDGGEEQIFLLHSIKILGLIAWPCATRREYILYEYI